jgi:hypothetical protein
MSFGWWVHKVIAVRRSTCYGVTSRRVIAASTTRRTASHSFDLAGDEPVRAAEFPIRPGGARRGGPVFVCPMGVEAVGAVERAIRLARTAGEPVPGACEPAAADGLGKEMAGPLARFLRPGELVLWAGRPGWGSADRRALAAFAVAAAVALAAAVILTQDMWSGLHRWATAVGAVGVCLVAAAVFLWLARGRAWWVVSSERILGAWGPGRPRVTWADLRSVRNMFLTDRGASPGKVSVQVGLPIAAGVAAGSRRGDPGAPARLVFSRWREAASFYHALSDARRAALRRPAERRGGVARAEWGAAAPGMGRGQLAEFLAFAAGSAVLGLSVGFAPFWIGALLDSIRGAGEQAGLWGSMAAGAAICGLAWWFASLALGRRLECHVGTQGRVVATRGLFDPVFVSHDLGGGGGAGPCGRDGRSSEARGAGADVADPPTGGGEQWPGSREAGGSPPDVAAAGLLEAGETPLWAGRAYAPPVSHRHWAGSLGGLTAAVAIGYAATFVGLSSAALLPAALVGAGAGIALWSVASRRQVANGLYAVTARRVVARTGGLSPRTRSVDLAAIRGLTLVEGADGIGDLVLRGELRRGGTPTGGGPGERRTRKVKLLLHGIPRAVDVFRLIQSARAEHRTADRTREPLPDPLEVDESARRAVAARLPAGEEVVWAGRPRQGVFVRAPGLVTLAALPLAMPLAVYALFPSWFGPESPLSRLSIDLAVGAGVTSLAAVAGVTCIDVVHRRATYYGVTGRRAIVVHGSSGGPAASFDLGTLTRVCAWGVRQRYGDVILTPEGGWPAGHGALRGWPLRDRLGFRAVRDPGALLALVQRARSGRRDECARSGRLRARAATREGRAEHLLRGELCEGEELLWAGAIRRPPPVNSADVATGAIAAAATLGAFVLLFGLDGPPPRSWAAALLLCAPALIYWLAGRFVVARLLRAGAAHGVTTRRVVTVTSFLRRRTTSTEFRDISDLVLVAGPDGRGSVAFGRPGVRRSRNPWGLRWLYRPRHGLLEGLPDAEAVYDVIRRARAEALRSEREG